MHKKLNFHGKSQSTRIRTKVMQNLKLSKKDFRVATIKLLQQPIINIIEMNRKISSSSSSSRRREEEEEKEDDDHKEEERKNDNKPNRNFKITKLQFLKHLMSTTGRSQ